MAMTECSKHEKVEANNLERVRYFPRQLITADDMRLEQEYFLEKQRRHNRFLHGWGIVCGFDVKAHPITGAPWNVDICSGYILGPYGDEIYSSKTVQYDLAACNVDAQMDPCEKKIETHNCEEAPSGFYLAIKYAECRMRPVRIQPTGCGCDDTACEYTRIRDSFELACLPDLPKSHCPEAPGAPELCESVMQHVIPCIACPEEPWIVLAKVTLPPAAKEIAEGDIDRSIRRLLASTVILQNKIVENCY